MMRIQLPEALKGHTLVTWVCCAYLFFSHVPRTTAVVNILTSIMLLLGVLMVVRRQLVVDWQSPMVRSLAAFLVIVVAGIAISPYREESLTPLRRDVLPMLLTFALLTGQVDLRSQTQRRQVAVLAGWSIIAAFVCRTFLALSDWVQQGVQNDVYSIDRAAARFFDFFAIDATLMMPVVVAAILWLPMRQAMRWLLAISVGVAWLLVIVSGVRAALVALGLVTVLQLLPWFWRHKKWTITAMVLLGLSVVVVSPSRIDKITERYATIFSTQTYQGLAVGSSSFYERVSIWKGVMEMVEKRPLLGYGLGWQKIHDVAYNDGYVDRWRQSDQMIDQSVANYFRYEKGQTNPHNLWVQILFETGALGLLSYASMLAILLARAIRRLRDKSAEAVDHWFSTGALAFLAAYMLINLMNGLWLTAGATLMLFIASELLCRRSPDCHNAGGSTHA